MMERETHTHGKIDRRETLRQRDRDKERGRQTDKGRGDYVLGDLTFTSTVFVLNVISVLIRKVFMQCISICNHLNMGTQCVTIVKITKEFQS